MSVEFLVGGLLRACYLVPATLAFCLAARHGGYLPLWLPQCGTIAAYLAYYFAEGLGWNGTWSVVGALIAGSALGVACHRLLFAGHVACREPYPALLRGVALSLVIENVAGLMSSGYALAFETLRPTWQVVCGWPLNDTLRVPDLVSLGALAVLAPGLWLFVNHTRLGLAYRAVASNRDLAREHGVNAARIDTLVIFGASSLCACSGILYALRYGLIPQMMTTPALKIVAVAVAVGPARLLVGATAVVMMGGVERLCQGIPGASGLEHGVGYTVLIIGVMANYVLRPLWRRWALVMGKERFNERSLG